MNGFHGRYKGSFRLQPTGSKRWKLVTDDTFLYRDFLHEVNGGDETDLASVPYRKLVLFLIMLNQAVVYKITELFARSEYPGNLAWGIIGTVWLLLVVYTVLAFPSINDTARPAIHHDLMYREQYPRDHADKMFYHGLRVYIGRFWATIFWLSVRVGGWRGYARCKKKHEQQFS